MTKQPEPISRQKHYYVLKDYKENGVGNWKKGTIIQLDPTVAIPYIGARILTSLASAIRTKLIPPIDPKAAIEAENRIKEETQFKTIIPEDEPEKVNKKTLARNTLKEAVLKKKSETSPDEDPKETVVLTSSDDKTVEAPEMTEQEKAIKAKIAALKNKGK